jgi:hypothetical protein
VVKRHSSGRFIPGNDTVPIVLNNGRASGSGWMGAENLALTGIRSLDCPARSESLCGTSNHGPHRNTVELSNLPLFNCPSFKRTYLLKCMALTMKEAQYVDLSKLDD